LLSDEDKTIGRNAFKFDPDFEIVMTLNWFHVAVTESFKKELLNTLNKSPKYKKVDYLKVQEILNPFQRPVISWPLWPCSTVISRK